MRKRLMREKEIYRSFIPRSSRFSSSQASSFGQQFFFLRVQEIETRSEMLRDAWLLKRGGVMTRTICSGVSTRLFLFSSTAESASYLFLLLLLRTPAFPSSHHLFRCLPAPVSPLRSPTDDEAGREVRGSVRLVGGRIIADLSSRVLPPFYIGSLRFLLS